MKNLRPTPTALLAGFIASGLLSLPVQAQETNLVIWGIQMEQLEYRRGDEDEDVFAWDGDAFIGTDEVKFRWLGEGQVLLDDDLVEELENRFVVQSPISDFFDAKAGVRVDTPTGPDRVYGVLGVAGLAQQWFEVDADLFVSETGDVSTRLDAEYEILLTNRLVLTPSLELDFAFTEDDEIGVGAGLSSGEFGLRLSYDLVDRFIAPYVGVEYERKFFRTADLARDEGEDVGALFGVVGVRIIY